MSALGLFTVVHAAGQFTKWSIPHALYWAPLLTGMGLLLSSFACVGVIWATRSYPKRDYFAKRAKRIHIPIIRELATNLIGGRIASTEILKGWHDKNPDTFYVIIESIKYPQKYKRIEELVGYLSVRPITKEAQKHIEAGTLTGGSLLPEHICSLTETPAALYIGGVVSKRFYGRAEPIAIAFREVDRYYNQGVRYLYTYPSTEDGLRLAKHHGFEPLSKINNVDTPVWRRVMD